MITFINAVYYIFIEKKRNSNVKNEANYERQSQSLIC